MGSLQRSEISAQSLSINKNGPSNKHEAGHLARGNSIFRDRDSKWPEQSVLVCVCVGRGGGGVEGREAVRGVEASSSGPLPGCFRWKVEPEEENQEK